MKNLIKRSLCVILVFALMFQSALMPISAGEKTYVDFMDYLEDPMVVIFQSEADIDMREWLINAYGVPEEITFECSPSTVSLNDYKDGDIFELNVTATDAYEGSCTVEAEIEAQVATLDGEFDYSYVPNVTLGVAANGKYTDAIGKALVTVNNYDKAPVKYVLDGFSYSKPIIFEKGMDTQITIKVQLEFDDYLSAREYIPLNNYGWTRDYGTLYKKEFTFNLTDAPVLVLPRVDYLDVESVWYGYIPKNLTYNGNTQNLVNVAGVDSTKGSLEITNQQAKNVGTYPVNIVVKLNDGIVATESSKDELDYYYIAFGDTRKWVQSAEGSKEVYTKSFNVTIDPAELNVATNNGSIVIGSKTNYTPAELVAESGASVTVNGVGSDGTISSNISYAWEDGSTTSKSVTPGTYKVKATITPNNSNYKATEKTLTISTKQKVEAVATFNDNLVYNGEEQELLSKVTFKNNGTEIAIPDTDYVISYEKDGVACENPTDAGTYTAFVSLNGSSGYVLDSQLHKLGEVKISQKPVHVETVTKVFDKTKNLINVAVDIKGVLDKDNVVAIAGLVEYSDVNVGTYNDVKVSNVKLSGDGSDNYVWSQDTSVTGTITPYPITVKAVDAEKTYGDQDPELTYVVEENTLSIDAEELSNVIVIRAEGEDVNTYAITIDQADGENPNFNITFQNATFTIKQKEIDISWGLTQFIPYTGNSLVPEAYATNLVNGDECILTTEVVETVDGAGVIPGTWTAKVIALSNSNYKLPENGLHVSVDFEIVNGYQNYAPVVSSTDETIDGKADGKITGVDNTMEYRKEGDVSYKSIVGSEVANLEDGTYYVRYAEKTYYNPSPDTTVVIGTGRMLTVSVPATQIGYTLTTVDAELVWNGSTTINIALADGYSKTDDFAVKVNNTEVELVNDQYVITDVQEDIAITVEGVEDITAPTAKITLDTYKWNTFFNDITFGLFFKETQTVTITAEDVNAGSGMGMIYYYLASQELTEAEVKDITAWEEYNGAFNIDPNNEYIIYAKAVDKVGNATYISSQQGIVLDAVAPVITGVQNEGIYYGNTEFGVDETYLDIVSVDDNQVELTDGKYTIVADGKEHTIVAVDKAGNSSEIVKVSVITISSLDDVIEDIKTTDVKSSDKDDIQKILDFVNGLIDSGKDFTDEEDAQLNDIKSNAESLIQKIEYDQKIAAAEKDLGLAKAKFVKKKLKVTWTKVEGADGYDIYVQDCGKKFSKKNIVKTVKNGKLSVTIKKLNGKKITELKNIKVKVRAYQIVDGKKVYITKGIAVHIAKYNSKKYTNAKKVKVFANSLTLKKEQIKKFKAKVVKKNSKKKLLSTKHAPQIRYYTTNSKVATVNKKGQIIGRNSGNCTIYVVALNGVRKKVKVTVE